MAYLESDIVKLYSLDTHYRNKATLKSAFAKIRGKLTNGVHCKKNQMGNWVYMVESLPIIEGHVRKLKNFTLGQKEKIERLNTITQEIPASTHRPSTRIEKVKTLVTYKKLISTKYAYIYALCEPITFQPKYVGASEDIQKRYTNHLSIFDTGTKEKKQWIRGLLDEGLQPFLTILEQCDNGDKLQREMYWTEKLLSENHNLFNSKIGNLNRSAL